MPDNDGKTHNQTIVVGGYNGITPLGSNYNED
jgi:hypothetical protein